MYSGKSIFQLISTNKEYVLMFISIRKALITILFLIFFSSCKKGKLISCSLLTTYILLGSRYILQRQVIVAPRMRK